MSTLQQSPSTKPRRDEPYDLSRFRLLIIEDSSFIADLLASSLTEMGVGQVLVATRGEKAKERILDHNAVQSVNNIDAIILDWLMPGLSGLDLLKWVRNHKSETVKFLPVIVCSAYTSYDIVEESRDYGATEVMVKPVSAEKLAKRILYVIDHPRPYIKTPDFFGPDRRRRLQPFEGSERRTMNPQDLVEHNEQLE